MRPRTHTHRHQHTLMHPCTHTHTVTHRHTPTHTHTHTHTHSRTQVDPRNNFKTPFALSVRCVGGSRRMIRRPTPSWSSTDASRRQRSCSTPLTCVPVKQIFFPDPPPNFPTPTPIPIPKSLSVSALMFIMGVTMLLVDACKTTRLRESYIFCCGKHLRTARIFC